MYPTHVYEAQTHLRYQHQSKPRELSIPTLTIIMPHFQIMGH